jgi:hypothetical protein
MKIAMKDRRPRKIKKIAKKRKAVADAVIMAKSAITAMNCAVQLATIRSRPTPVNALPVEKALNTAQACVDAANILQAVLSEIKPWRAYA